MTDEILARYNGNTEAINRDFSRISLEQFISTVNIVTRDTRYYSLTTALHRAFMQNPLISRKPLSSVSQLASLPDLELRNYPKITGTKITPILNKALLLSLSTKE